MQSRRLPTAGAALALVTLIGACGHGTGTATRAAAGSGAERDVRGTPAPIATVEPTCMATYPQYASAQDLLTQADLVVRVTATGPSRDYDQYPLSRAEDGSYLPPREEMTPEEMQQRDLVASPATAITVRVEEVLKGAVQVGEGLEINQNPCTTRPLPVGAGVQYVFALEDLHLGPGVPLNQLNDSQAAWQVAADRSLLAVDPGNGLGITSVDQLAELAV